MEYPKARGDPGNEPKLLWDRLQYRKHQYFWGQQAWRIPDELEAIVRSAVELAVSARNEAEKKTGRDDLYVSLDIGPTGRLLKPLGDLDFEEAVRVFGEVVRIGADAGADLVLIETMSDTYELKAAVLAAKENSDLPVCATVTFDSGRKLLTGADVEDLCGSFLKCRSGLHGSELQPWSKGDPAHRQGTGGCGFHPRDNNSKCRHAQERRWHNRLRYRSGRVFGSYG